MTADDERSAGALAAVTYDHDDDTVIVIIGSGAAGGTLADELTGKGINVVILEAGRRFDLSEIENDEVAMDAKLSWSEPRVCTGTSIIARMFPDTPTSMCKAVGGSTLHWGGMCPRLLEHEFKTATIYGAIPGADIADWPFGLGELEPYYGRAEDKMGVTGTHGIPRHAPTNNFKVMAAAARRIGYTDVRMNNLAINSAPRNGRNACDHIGFCMQGCASGAKWSTANSELPRAEASGRCELRAESMALRIEHGDDGRVRGVLYVDRAGREHLQAARAVCVAGNSIETVRLLLNSESSAFPQGLANGSGLVGKYYMRHSSGNLFGEFGKPVNMHRGVQVAGLVRDEARHDPDRGFAGGFYIVTTSCGLPGFAASLNPGKWGRAHASWLEAYDHVVFMGVIGEDLAIATNRVTLHGSEKDRYGLPIPCLHIDDHPNETPMQNYGYKKMDEMCMALGARRTIETQAEPAYHHLGVCRMSANPRDGVVDPWGRAHDVLNLFVSDGSVFPSSGAANPTLTVVALAIRQAEHITQMMAADEL